MDKQRNTRIDKMMLVKKKRILDYKQFIEKGEQNIERLRKQKR